MNDELKTPRFYFIVHRPSFIVSSHAVATADTLANFNPSPSAET